VVPASPSTMAEAHPERRPRSWTAVLLVPAQRPAVPGAPWLRGVHAARAVPVGRPAASSLVPGIRRRHRPVPTATLQGGDRECKSATWPAWLRDDPAAIPKPGSRRRSSASATHSAERQTS
jgi:hypothetical protein